MNVYEPVLVGVPEIAPDVLNVSPDGRFPDDTVQVAPAVLDVRVAEYDVFTVPEGRLSVVIVIVGIGLTVIESCFSADCESFTALTVNLDVPAVVGVPVIAPVEVLRVSPAGKEPEITDHVAPVRFAARVAV